MGGAAGDLSESPDRGVLGRTLEVRSCLIEQMAPCLRVGRRNSCRCRSARSATSQHSALRRGPGARAAKAGGWIDPSDPRWSGRRFAGARLRCQKRRYDGVLCGGFGHLSIVPPERINPASAIERVHLACGRCVPSWEILDVRLDLPPRSTITLGKGSLLLPGLPRCRHVARARRRQHAVF